MRRGIESSSEERTTSAGDVVGARMKVEAEVRTSELAEEG
jgi:hypothetical protein